MDKQNSLHYKNKLIKERQRVNALLEQMKNNEVIKSKAEIASELSLYDNHPADIATETFDIEKGMALEANEVSLLNKVDDALESIEDGSYGICKQCGKEISKERLEFLPYAKNCIECENRISAVRTFNSTEPPIEESVLGRPFGYGFNHHSTTEVEFDAEDSYQAVESFNKLDGIEEYYYSDDDYVEQIEKISNEEYKNQLPS